MDSEYFRRYTELRELVKKCYVDYYVLKGMENFNQFCKRNSTHSNNYFLIIEHHCQLTKEHFVLNLWKLTDRDSKSNSLFTLKNYLRVSYEQIKPDLSKDSRMFFDSKLSKIRKKMLAHNDIQKSNVSVCTDELFEYLEDTRKHLNGMCCMEIDDRVKQLSDTEVFVLSGTYQMSQHLLVTKLFSDDT